MAKFEERRMFLQSSGEKSAKKTWENQKFSQQGLKFIACFSGVSFAFVLKVHFRACNYYFSLSKVVLLFLVDSFLWKSTHI